MSSLQSIIICACCTVCMRGGGKGVHGLFCRRVVFQNGCWHKKVGRTKAVPQANRSESHNFGLLACAVNLMTTFVIFFTQDQLVCTLYSNTSFHVEFLFILPFFCFVILRKFFCL